MVLAKCLRFLLKLIIVMLLFQAVLNWQFVHSVHLWCQMFESSASASTQGTSSSSELQPLVFPLAQVIAGALKVASTARYFPMRFHLCDMLSQLTTATKVFVPVLPHYLEVLNTYNFNKKTTKVSMKPIDFSCILKVTKTQLLENGMKDATMDKLYGGMLTYLNQQSSKISFPELSLPAVTQIKAFLKVCNVANHCRKMRQLLDKVNENSQHVVQQRRKQTTAIAIHDQEKINAFEMQLEASVTPLSRYYNSWKGVKAEERRQKAKEEQEKDYDFIPKLKKKSSKKGVAAHSNKLWEDDEDDDDSVNVSRSNIIQPLK